MPGDTDASPLVPPDELEQRIARTYAGEDPWERVIEYRLVTGYREDHPDASAYTIANELDVPRSRVRSWFDGTEPDPVRGIAFATERDWLDATPSNPAFRGLNVLVSWVFSGGSIERETYKPRFTVGATHLRRTLADAADRVGLDVTVHEPDDPGRAPEATMAANGSVLGRMLAVYGAPTGGKHADRELHLPRYLVQAPEPVRLDFARTYVLNRGTTRSDRPDLPIQFREARSTAYHQELRAFLASLVDGDALTRSGDQLHLKPAAANALYMPPEFAGET